MQPSSQEGRRVVDPLNTTLAEAFLHTVGAHGSRPALWYEGRCLTYAELEAAVGALQAGLEELGVRPGHRLALLFPNTPHFFIAFFAAQMCGAEVIPLNCLHAPPELVYVLNDSQARWLLALHAFADTLAEVVPQCPGLQGVVMAGPAAGVAAVSWEHLIQAHHGQQPRAAERSPQDVAALLYTSGTTGRPKGAMLTHRNFIFDAYAADQTLLLQPDDILLGALPLFHAYGFTVNMVLPVLCGCSVVLVPKFLATACLELIEAHKVTFFAGVPTMFSLMLRTRRTPDYDLRSLKTAVSGGAPMPLEVMRAFEERFQVYMLEGYGPTEAAPIVSVNPRYGVRKLGSVGPPIPGVKVRIADDDDQTLPTGAVGELCVQGPNVMLGYWQAPELTAQTIVNGWLHTGDLARLDEDGYVYIVDRKKDLIIVGGMNVYPREVEEVIYELEPIAEVAVVGVPSSIKGEDVVAYVAFKEGMSLPPAEIREHCRRRLAAFKVPSEIVVEPELPKSPVGKVLRRAVRAMALERFGRRR
jgi:long-chain acyl-CoA synthetase